MLFAFVENIALGLCHCWLLITEWMTYVALYDYFVKTQSVARCFLFILCDHR